MIFFNIPIPYQNDKHLVQSIISGDSHAFERLFKKYSVQLLNFASGRIKNRQAAEDMVQEVFVSIWLNQAKLNPELPVKSYLYKAVLNQVYKHYRHIKVEFDSKDLINLSKDAVKTPEENLDEKERAKIIRDFIEKLPEKCREIFKMNRYQGLKYSEIAEILDISVNTVKTQMGRAFKTLSKNLSFLQTVLF